MIVFKNAKIINKLTRADIIKYSIYTWTQVQVFTGKL